MDGKCVQPFEHIDDWVFDCHIVRLLYQQQPSQNILPDFYGLRHYRNLCFYDFNGTRSLSHELSVNPRKRNDSLALEPVFQMAVPGKLPAVFAGYSARNFYYVKLVSIPLFHCTLLIQRPAIM